MRQAVAKALTFLDRRERRRWFLLAPLAVAIALLEAAGTGLIFALIRVVGQPGSAALASVPAWLPIRSDAELVTAMAALVAIFYLVKNAVRLYEVYAVERCAGDTSVAISRRLLRRYLRAPYALHLQRNAAQLMRDVRSSAEIVSRDILFSAIVVASDALVVAAVLSVVILAAPGPALAAAAVVGGSTAALYRATRWRHAQLGAEAHELRATVTRNLRQALGSVKESRILGRERFFEDSFARSQADLARTEVQRRALARAPHLLVETLFVAGLALLILVSHAYGIGDLVPLLGLFAYAGLRILPSLRQIVEMSNRIQFGAAPLEAIHRDWVELAAHAEPARSAALSGRRFERDIVFEGVSYAYPGSGRTALRQVDLRIRRGESVGIVGSTAAGKSTLVDLLLGLLRPEKGRIRVDGTDIGDDTPAWQDQIGYVPQSIYLIDDTLRRNVALGLEEREIAEERVTAAIRTARLEDWVASLPQGLDTVVGDRGVRLSGGERQRVAIARALYRDPEVLVFDEATAALDNETEQELSREIETLRGQKTLIIVAHRLSTVRRCHRLILLRDGRIDDAGPYDELLARNPHFRRMAQAVGPEGSLAPATSTAAASDASPRDLL